MSGRSGPLTTARFGKEEDEEKGKRENGKKKKDSRKNEKNNIIKKQNLKKEMEKYLKSEVNISYF